MSKDQCPYLLHSVTEAEKIIRYKSDDIIYDIREKLHELRALIHDLHYQHNVLFLNARGNHMKRPLDNRQKCLDNLLFKHSIFDAYAEACLYPYYQSVQIDNFI